MKSFNFSACCVDFGVWNANSIEDAQEAFAKDAGYFSWSAMIEQAEEFGGNNVEIKELI
jgi:hypothetical protein